MNGTEEPSFARALKRYQAVTLIVSRVQAGSALSEAIEDINNKQPGLSRRSLYRWYRQYQLDKFQGLLDKNRKSKVSGLPDIFIDFLQREKAMDPEASIPELIKRAQQRQIVRDPIDRSSVYRTCKRLGLPVKRAKKIRDSRRFEYKNRMLMVLCDGKHFRAGPGNLKRVVLTFIDDCSRFTLHAICGASESKELFLKGMYEVLRRHGRMRSVYLDHGSGFIAKDVEIIFAQLGIGLIHGEVGYPQGRGKIERFNRTINQSLLRGFVNNPTIDPSFASLNLRINHYLQDDYNQSQHMSLGESPKDRFLRDPYPLDFFRDEQDLMAKFILRRSRKVSADHIVSLNGIAYETPLGMAYKKIVLYENAITHAVAIDHQGQRIALHPVDLNFNASAKRTRSRKEEEEESASRGASASLEKFNENFKPIVDKDGNFILEQEAF
jgi:putative transposase